MAQTPAPDVARSAPAPEGPARVPRLWDRRVGPFFKAKDRYIMRQHLVRRDPARPSEVVRPIVYTIDPTVPREWVPWIRRGIEAWSPAFEQIGFRHAIIIRDATAGSQTTPGADSAGMPGCTVVWSHLDALIVGLTTLDADSTGAVTRCRIALDDHGLEQLRQYAFLYLGATNPALRYPFADSVSGRILQGAVTHEVGHSLGLSENFTAGTFYPTDSLHRAGFVRRFGHAPSVMGYAHFNYVAHATDRLPYEALFARVGPVDVWALGWAYRPVPGATTPQDELPTLERWRAVQDTAFAMRVATNTPGRGTGGMDAYLLGNDLVASAAAISDNLALTVPQIDAQAAATPAGQTVAEGLRRTALNVWPTVVAAAGDLVGGAIPERPYARDAAQQRTVPIDSARQVRALRFALAHVMYGQDPLIRALFGRAPGDSSLMLFPKAAPGWTAEQWRGLQQQVLSHLLNHWLPGVVEQANTTHVLPVWCDTMRRLADDLQKARRGAASPEERSQAGALLQQLTRVTDPTSGACRGV